MDRLEITQPFNAQSFKAFGDQVLAFLASHLETVSRREGPVLPAVTPDDQRQKWPSDFTNGPHPDWMQWLSNAVADFHRLHHPRYVGHQVTSPLPWSALLDFVGAFLNNGSAVFEMGPVSTAMERSVSKWFAERIGYCPEKADGFFTHGGSAGNLTALLAARQHGTPYDVWGKGIQNASTLCMLTSDQSHYSVQRSAQIMGLGSQSVIIIPTDDHFRMRIDRLREAIVQAKKQGKTPLAVIGSAMSTPTGAIDPLEDIGKICQEFGLWFHVDGAHGGAMVVSDALKPRLAGIEYADSVIIDAHKMMLMPALATLVIFKDGKRSFETFSQQASYLFSDQDPSETWYDLAHRTLECTKRSLGFQVYGSLKAYGTGFFAKYIEQMCDLGQSFAKLVQSRPDWELATQPDGNILCFRYAPAGIEDPETFQAWVRDLLVTEGSYYLTKTQLRGRNFLRTTLINPRTQLGDLEGLLQRIERAAQERQEAR